MEPEPGPEPPTSDDWVKYLAIVLIVLASLSILNVIVSQTETASGPQARGPDPYGAIQQGDYEIKQALAASQSQAKLSPEKSANNAIADYQDALPWPAAYRRIGVARQEILGRLGLPELLLLSSKAATKRIPKDRVRKLVSETAMWRAIYGPGQLDRKTAGRFISRIKDLNLGPLKAVATARVYRNSGQPRRADKLLADSRKAASASVAGYLRIALVMLGAGFAGLVLIVLFLSIHVSMLRDQDRPDAPPGALLRGFLYYLLGTFVLTTAIGGLIDVWVRRSGGTAAELVTQAVGSLGALIWSMTILVRSSPAGRPVLREIGLRVKSVAGAIGWGAGGFCGALPLVMAAAVLNNSLVHALLPRVRTPEHPLTEMLAGRAPGAFAAAVLVAVIVAPIAEEIAFRGMLYGALRTRIRVWPSVLISGALFALAHPTLPGQFLPLMALGCVFALLRERTGSLVPGMVAHGLNNGVELARLWFYL